MCGRVFVGSIRNDTPDTLDEVQDEDAAAVRWLVLLLMIVVVAAAAIGLVLQVAALLA